MKISSIKQNIEASNLVEVQFSCNDYYVDKYTKLLKGTVVFDHSNSCLIDNYNIEAEFIIENPERNKSSHKTVQLKRSSQFEYSIINGLPFVSSCESLYDEYPKKVEGVIKFPVNNFSKIKYLITKTGNNVDDSLFYLSYYGFPEPADLNPNHKYNLFRHLLIIIGIGLAGTGFYLRYKVPVCS